MTIDRASVEEGARLAAEATPGPWERGTYAQVPRVFWAKGNGTTPIASLHDSASDGTPRDNAAFIAHWNPEFAAEVVQELQRLWRMEEALGTAKLRHGVLSMAIDDGDDYGEHVGLQRHRRAVYEGQAEILALWEVALANPAAEEK